MCGERINGAKSWLFFLPELPWPVAVQGWERKAGAHGLLGGTAHSVPHIATRLPCRSTQSNARDMLTHSLWTPWLEGDLQMAFAGNGDISTDLSVSNMPKSLTARNICQRSALQSLGTPLISALPLALILMHFIPSSTQMCCPASFLPQSTVLIKVSWPLFCLHVPHHPLHLCVDERERTGSERSTTSSWKQAACGTSSLTS